MLTYLAPDNTSPQPQRHAKEYLSLTGISCHHTYSPSPPLDTLDTMSAVPKGDYEGIRNEVRKILKKPGYDDGSIGPVLVR